MFIHLMQLGCHVRAADIEGVAGVVHAQVVANQHIPSRAGLGDPWQHMLQGRRILLCRLAHPRAEQPKQELSSTTLCLN